MSPESLLFTLRLLLALVLYSFLGAILFNLWHDLRQTNHGPLQVPPAHLIVFDGEAAATAFRLQSTTDIGRAAGNIVRLDDDTVSAHHARISFHGGQWWLEDLASRNGTVVNELPIEEPLVVTYGDEIRFGRVRTRLESGLPDVELDGEESPATTAPQAARD